MHWTLYSFDQLTTAQLYALLQARSDVFVLEQQCLYQDLDGKDLPALHLCCWSGRDAVLAYARLLPPGLAYAEPAIGRVLTSQAGRGKGLARELMQRAIAACHQQFGQQAIRIGAQMYLQDFYQSLGFVAASDSYDEDGIAHVQMLLPFTAPQ